MTDLLVLTGDRRNRGPMAEDATARVGYRSLLSDHRLLVVLLVGVTGSLANNVASPALPGVADHFAVSAARVGLVMTAFTVPTMVTVPLTGVLADTYGRRRVVIPSLVVFGLAGTAIGLVDSFGAVLALRGVQGAAFAGIMPLSVTILGDLYSGATGSSAQGLRVSVNGLNAAAVPAVVGVLVALSWSYPFFIYAVALPAAVVVALALPETGAPQGGDLAIASTLRSYARDFLVETRSPEVRTLLAGGFARDFVRLAVMTFVPLFAVQGLGATTAQAGAIIGLRGFVRLFVSPVAGSVVARTSRTGALLAALGLTAAGAVSIGLSSSALVLAAAVAVYGVGDGLFAPVLKNAVTDVADPEYRAGVVNGMQLLKSGAQSLSPVVFGVVLATLGYRPLFLAAALVSVAYATLVVWVFR